MKLSRIRIEQFKQFRQPIEIADLEPGINLFAGANEAGKSTIVAAIRAAFFERHRSGSVDDLRPWGDSSASPTVTLAFTVAGQACTLTKSFLGKKRCELQIGTRRLDGADAEDHVAELLGFQHAGKGVSKAEHWGIPGLLWIEQGSAQEIRESVKNATDHLRTALNESLGEVASSGGDDVMATVEAARNELLTVAAGRPRGAYADAIAHETAVAGALRELDAELADYRHKVDALAALRVEHSADETDKPWLGFRAQQQAASDRLDAIRRLEETLAGERQRVDHVDGRIKLLRAQLETFATQEKTVETRRSALASASTKQSECAALVAQWIARRAEAAARHEAARARLSRARLDDTRRGLVRERDDNRRKAQAAAAALAQADTEQMRLHELQRQAAASEIGLDNLNGLREQHAQLRELHIQQDAVATRVAFTLDAASTIEIGSERVAGSGERLLREATTLVLPGLGRVEVSPGGADLSDLRSRERELAERHTLLLQRLGLPSLEAAETRFRVHGERLADLKTAEATLKALAPKGAEALRSELTALAARGEEIEHALQQLPPAPAELGANDETNDGTCVAAPASVAVAEAAEEAAAKSLAGINDTLHAAQLAAGNAQAAFEAATRELAGASALVDSPERAERVALANRDLVDARAEQSTLANRIAVLEKQVVEARPDILQQDVERFRRSAEQTERRFDERREALMRLEVALQTAGTQGLDERRAEFARDLDQAQRRVAELRRRANVLDHLLSLLRDKRRALTRRLQAPLQKHLNRYLQLLFPEASLEIDENLSPGPLTRMGSNGIESGEFESLSFGAREQMGVISRLAYADLLQEAGRPTLIILDDALVHSDAVRLAQMKRVLFDAATRHQILLFTCHPDNWRDLGVAARSLESLRAGGG